jgi:hypothetical protein
MTTAKKTAQQNEAEAPPEFNWVSLAQPTPADDTKWEVQATSSTDVGPWWVEDSNGARFATYALLKGLKRLDESPFTRSGELRTPIPGGTDTAPAD